MNDRQLTSFLKICKTNSFSKAAKESYISIAAIKEQIDRLEEDLDFKLFIRNNHGVTLTNNGKIFYEALIKMKDIYDKAITQIKGNNSQINIGVAYSQYPDFLIQACKSYLKDNQDNLHFIELPYNEHLNALREHKIDITIIAKPKESELNNLVYKKLCDDTYAFGMSDKHPLAHQALITKEKLNSIKVLCGNYDYMQYPFKEMLKDSKATLIETNSEYNLDLKAKTSFDEEVIVFHSLWTKSYAQNLKVIKSNINAGSIGAIYRIDASNNIKQLAKTIKENLQNK